MYEEVVVYGANQLLIKTCVLREYKPQNTSVSYLDNMMVLNLDNMMVMVLQRKGKVWNYDSVADCINTIKNQTTYHCLRIKTLFLWL